VPIRWSALKVSEAADMIEEVIEQDYQGYQHYLLDFRNGFWESPIDNYRSHYACLTLTKFKD
jgi:hypothetical protein